MSERSQPGVPTSDEITTHYGPVYPNQGPLGQSLAACRPGAVPSNMTTHKPWVNCDKCKESEAYRNGK